MASFPQGGSNPKHPEDPSEEDPNTPEQDELTRVIREGVPQPQGIKESLQMTAGKLTGRVPLGATAPNKTVRKALAGGGELLAVIKYGLIGALLTLMGLLMLWACITPWNLKGVVFGAGMLFLGIWCLKTSVQAFRNLRSISKT